MPRYPEGIWGDGDPRNERRDLAQGERGRRRRWRRKTKVEAVAAAKCSRTCVINARYTPTCINIYHLFLSVRGVREQTPSETKQKQTESRGSRLQIGYVYVRNIYTPTCVYTPELIFFCPLCAAQGRKQTPSAKWSRTNVNIYINTGAGTIGDNEVEAITAAK